MSIRLGGGGTDGVSTNNDLESVRTLTRAFTQYGQLELEGLTTSVTGSAAVVLRSRVVEMTTGTTTSSAAVARTDDLMGWVVGEKRGLINYDRRIIFAFYISLPTALSANGVIRIQLGKDEADTIPAALNQKGIGFHITPSTVNGLAHNGTSLDSVALSTNINDTFVHQLVMDLDGLGNVTYLIDGTEVGTSTNGPTGDGGNGEALLTFELENGAGTTNERLDVYHTPYTVEQ